MCADAENSSVARNRLGRAREVDDGRQLEERQRNTDTAYRFLKHRSHREGEISAEIGENVSRGVHGLSRETCTLPMGPPLNNCLGL